MNKVMQEVEWVRYFQWRGGEEKLPRLLYTDDLVLNGESEEDPKTIIGHFVEIYERKCSKVHVEKK